MRRQVGYCATSIRFAPMMSPLYVGMAIIVATACLVNAFSVAYDLRRLETWLVLALRP
jgi:hypothetical protein